MNNLERLGLEAVAYQLLGSRMQAAMLLALLNGGGRFIHWTNLGASNGYYYTGRAATTANAVAVRVCLLRQSLEDVGLAGSIESAPRGEGPAYAIPEPMRSQIMDRLAKEAAQ